MQQYLDLGLDLTPADNSREAGINEVWQALVGGRLKVFKSLRPWFGEYRIYRRDEKGHIIKENDHIMDATRYLVMSGIAISCTKPSDEDDEYYHNDSGRSDVGGY